MKKFFLIILFFIFFFSNSFAFIEFKQSKNVSSDTEQARGINFKPDGTIMYITNRKGATGSEGQKWQVTQYALSTPFDISTAIKTSQTDLLGSNDASVLKYPHAIEFKPDGTKMFVTAGDAVASVYQYNLTTPWDSSTAVFEARHNEGRTDVKHLRTLAFKPDGTRMFVGGKDDPATTGKIKQFTLSNPWDLSSGVSDAGLSDDLGSAEPNLRNAQFDPNGSILYIGGNDSDNIHKFTLSTAWDITTISSSFTTFDLVSGFSQMRGFIFVAGFTKLFVADDTATTSTILEYSPSCSIITCNDPSDDAKVKAIIEANVESAKRIIRHNTLPIFHRMEWLRRHKDKDNLNNLNLEINFTDKKVNNLVNGLKGLKKQKDRDYNSNDWFQWSEGRISLGKRHTKNGPSRDAHSYGFSAGADKIKKDNKDVMHGYVFQYGNDKTNIGDDGTKLDTDAFSFALYQTKLDEDNLFTDGIIGLSILDIDQKRVNSYSDVLKGNRDGHQIFGSFNFGKRVIDKKVNLNPNIKLDLGYTRLKSFKEKTNLGNTLADTLFYRAQNIKTGLATVGILLDTTDKRDGEIIHHYGQLDYVADLSQSSDAEFYYLSDQSTIYNYKTNDKSKHNYRIGYGLDITSITGWSLVLNFERFGMSGKGYSNEFYILLGYVPIDDMKFSFELDAMNNNLVAFSNKINEYDVKITSNYNFLSDKQDHTTNIFISNNF